MCAFCPLLTGSLALLGKPRQKEEEQGFGVVGRPCDVQVAAPTALLSHPGQPSKSQTPQHLQRGAEGLQVSPLGLAEQVPQDEPTMGTPQDRTGQGRAQRLNPQHPKRHHADKQV